MKKLLLLASLSLAFTCSAQDGTFIPGHVNRNGVFIPGHFENYDMNGMAPQAPRQMYVAPVEPEGYGRYLAMQYLERQRAIQYRREQAGIRYFYRKLAKKQRKEKRAAERAKRK